MVFFPTSPIPSSVSAPAIIDPVWRFEADAGIELRRVKHSRPRRRYTLDYLGKTVTELRIIRDFFNVQRGGALAFQWFHPTALEFLNIDTSTTPVTVYYEHGLTTGQWIGIVQSPVTNYNAFWQVTRINRQVLTLNGSLAAGGGPFTAYAFVYLPTAVGLFSGDVMAAPDKLIGPEQWYPSGYVNRVGAFNFQCVIEEVF